LDWIEFRKLNPCPTLHNTDTYKMLCRLFASISSIAASR